MRTQLPSVITTDCVGVPDGSQCKYDTGGGFRGCPGCPDTRPFDEGALFESTLPINITGNA